MAKARGLHRDNKTDRLLDADSRRYMPEVLFQPQESGPRNRANAKPIEPTPYYNQSDLPVFRPMGPNDAEDVDGLPLGKPFHPQDWDKQRSR